MSVLNVLIYPHPSLATPAKPVTDCNDPAVQQAVDDLIETMYAQSGVGLAATQVNIPWRIFVMDASRKRREPLIFINHKIIHQEGLQTNEEGCLSFPGIYAKVQRAAKVHVETQDRHGQTFKYEIEGYPAVCVQHEGDHLDGKVFIDHLSPLKRERLLKRMDKFMLRKMAKEEIA